MKFHLLFIALCIISCERKSDLTPSRELLEGTWEFVGYYNDSTLLNEHGIVYFFDLFSDSAATDLVTDSGIWKVTYLESTGQELQREQVHYFSNFLFLTDTSGFFHEDYIDPLNPDQHRTRFSIRNDSIITEYLRPQSWQPFLDYDPDISFGPGNINILSNDTIEVIEDRIPNVFKGQNITARFKRKNIP